jgi:Asp-tRNA(Asn)/Glu-tRNA(Gln) amidotransferase A subunit family amidase
LIGNDAQTLLTQPASELLRRVAADEMSAADLVRSHLARIDRLSHLNAFVDIRAEAALTEAAAQDEAAACGVPAGRSAACR